MTQMKIQFKSFKWLILALLLFSSCGQKANNNKLEKILDSLNTGSFKKEVPFSQYSSANYNFDLARKTERLLELRNISHGVDSLEIRVRLDYFRQSPQIIRIIIDSVCKAELIDFFTPLVVKGGSERYELEFKTIRTLSPKNGWIDLLRRLVDLQVLTLPDCTQIVGYKSARDSDGVVVEVGGRNFYRIYEYWQPWNNKNIKEVQNLEKIIEVLTEEFGFQLTVEL